MQPATTEAATESALQLDNGSPLLQQGKEAEDYLWMIWEVMVTVSMSPDATSHIHEGVVSI